MLDTLIEVDVLHTTLAVHEHEAVVADELFEHRHEALVIHKVRCRSHSSMQVVLNEVPRIRLGLVSGITCMQYAVVHHGDEARNHIIGMAVEHIGLAVCSPAEVNGNITIVIGQALYERSSIAKILRQSLGDLEPLGCAIHEPNAVRVGCEDVAQ